MEATTLYYTGQLVSTLIGNDIMTKAISDTASTIYNILYGLVDVSDKKLDNVMEELDIKENLRIIDSVISSMKGRHSSKTVQIGLEQLHEIICHIREDLKQIRSNFDYHATRYFAGYRRIDNSVQIKNLTRHKKTLDQRLELFIKILNIEHNSSPALTDKETVYPPFQTSPQEEDNTIKQKSD
jgi:hypothetical protein